MSQEYEQDLSDNAICNQSGNVPFHKVLEARLSRRDILKGGLAGAATTFFAAASPVTYASKVGFNPVPVAEGSGPWPSISSDYQWDVLIPWGEPLEPDGPAFNYPPNAADQAKQVGIGHDGMWYFPIKSRDSNRCGWDVWDWNDYQSWHKNMENPVYRRGNWHGVLCINHEFGRNTHVLAKEAPENLEDVRVSQHAHGVSVVELMKFGGRADGKWRQVKSDIARRIHVNTPVEFSGPVEGSDLLKTPNGNIPLGTVNNCANGYTPWGTYLTCEENFNGYFGATGEWTATPEQERYGFSESGFGYGWQNFDKRFDLSDPDYQNEENRFGWIVEIDPMDGTSKPVKRTALGRVKHEGIALTVGAGGRVVGYMGDDQRFDYIYKFVSEGNWREMLHAGKSPLDYGKLYVARFNEDGTGDWLELTIDNSEIAQRFSSQEEVLTYARIAADILGATPMDRPEWTTVAPDGLVYCTLTNNSRREVADAANPLAPNADGHIIRWKDTERFTGLHFDWDIYLISQSTHGTEDTFSDPDGLWADPDGRLFIQTDGGQTDGGEEIVLNNQMLVSDLRSGDLRRLFTGVTSDEITGIAVTPNRKTMFINSQHPGNGDPTLTNFPAPFDGVTIPRDSTIVITRKNFGIIGT